MITVEQQKGSQDGETSYVKEVLMEHEFHPLSLCNLIGFHYKIPHHLPDLKIIAYSRERGNSQMQEKIVKDKRMICW